MSASSRDAATGPAIGSEARATNRKTEGESSDAASGTVIVRVHNEPLRAQGPILTEEEFYVDTAAPRVVFIEKAIAMIRAHSNRHFTSAFGKTRSVEIIQYYSAIVKSGVARESQRSPEAQIPLVRAIPFARWRRLLHDLFTRLRTGKQWSGEGTKRHKG